MRWRTNAVVDARQIGNVSRVLEIEVFTVPTGLEVDLCSHSVDTIGAEHIVLLCEIVSFIYTVETYPVGHRPCIEVCQCRVVV